MNKSCRPIHGGYPDTKPDPAAPASIYVRFADNGFIRKWGFHPFPDAARYVRVASVSDATGRKD